MRRRFFPLLLGLLTLPLAAVQAESSVWVASNGTATVFLCGSVHILRSADYPLPAEYGQAYRRSRRVVQEIDLSEMEKPESRKKLMASMFYTDGTTLKEHVSDKAYARLEAYCGKRHMALENFKGCRPWALAMTLMMMELKRLQVQPTNGVDRVFDLRAREDGKPVGGLETMDEQLGFLTLIDKGLDDDQVIQSVDELEDLGAKINDMVDAWRTGDEKKLQETMLKEFKDYPKLYQALVADRNRKWVPRIEEFLKGRENVMVVVGAAHLVGDDSVVAMLRKKGYRVEKLGK